MLGTRGYPETFSRIEPKLLTIHLGVPNARHHKVAMLSALMDIHLCLTPGMDLCEK